MNTENKSITPEQAGLSLAVLSGPRGEVREERDHDTGKPLPGWPCIAYTCQISNERRQVIWTGSFRLGVGHVKWPRKCAEYPQGFTDAAMTRDETYCLNTVRMNPGAQIKDLQLWANTAAKLAKFQKVAPKLEDVCHSLLMDGAAFFDGLKFEDWAGDYGYSSDSIKAKETFEQCDRIGRDLSRHLSRETLAALREWAGNY